MEISKNMTDFSNAYQIRFYEIVLTRVYLRLSLFWSPDGSSSITIELVLILTVKKRVQTNFNTKFSITVIRLRIIFRSHTFDCQVDLFSDWFADTVTRYANVQSRIVSVQSDDLQCTIGKQLITTARSVDLKFI